MPTCQLNQERKGAHQIYQEIVQSERVDVLHGFAEPPNEGAPKVSQNDAFSGPIGATNVPSPTMLILFGPVAGSLRLAVISFSGCHKRVHRLSGTSCEFRCFQMYYI